MERTPIRRTYNIKLRDGKWLFSGQATFIGNHRSNWSRFSLIADDGEPGGRNEHLQFVSTRWQDLGNSTITVYRDNDPGFPEPPYRYVDITARDGKGSNGSYKIEISQA